MLWFCAFCGEFCAYSPEKVDLQANMLAVYTARLIQIEACWLRDVADNAFGVDTVLVCGAVELYCITLTGISIILSTRFISMIYSNI